MYSVKKQKDLNRKWKKCLVLCVLAVIMTVIIPVMIGSGKNPHVKITVMVASKLNIRKNVTANMGATDGLRSRGIIVVIVP